MKLNNFTKYADYTHSTRDHMTDEVTPNFGFKARADAFRVCIASSKYERI